MKTRIKEIRESQGLSQNELARKADLHPGQISRIEKEERTMTVETMVKICKALKVSSDYFLGLDDDFKDKKE